MGFSRDYDNIWDAAWKTVDYLETQDPDFKGDHAYTIIFSQSTNTRYFGQFCASNYAKTDYYVTYDTVHDRWGSYLLLKMR